MIATEELQELAEFWAPESDALTFYLGHSIARELAHREDPILAKETIHDLFGGLEGASKHMRADLARLIEVASSMRGYRPRAKIVFACASKDLWREYDPPGSFPVQLSAGHSFSLLPLLAAAEESRRYCIALADRNKRRLLILQSGEVIEHSSALDEDKEWVRTTGRGGSAHVERQVEERVHQHFKFLADHLLHFHEHGDYDALLIGCRSEIWPEIEQTLHPELRRILISHFHIDPGLASPQEVQERAEAILREKESQDERAMLERAAGEAARDGLAAMGVSSVAGSLEKGEVQTLLLSPESGSGQEAPGAVGVCVNCDHIQLGDLTKCDLCDYELHLFSSAAEAFLRPALAAQVEVRVLHSAKLPRPGDAAAVLRFRSDRTAAQSLAS
jgi:peptide subunit release factor 1 (eRF1)